MIALENSKEHLLLTKQHKNQTVSSQKRKLKTKWQSREE